MSNLENSTPLVSVLTLTYNHESYIKQCLEGILMQKTNFVFEILIHDDASTDKTAQIIKEYESKFSGILKPIYQRENQHEKKVGIDRTFQYPRARGKYIAICEGDDYWTDPLKLQKQVDFLENNEEYGLVFTDIDINYQDKGKMQKAAYKNHIMNLVETFNEHLLEPSFLAPCTWLFKKDLLLPSTETYKDGSYPMMLDFLATSKIKFMDEVTTTYRILQESASHTRILKKRYIFSKSVFQIQKDYIKKYNVECEISSLVLKKTYSMLLPNAIATGDQKFINEVATYADINKFYKLKILIVLSKYVLFKYFIKILYKLKGFK